MVNALTPCAFDEFLNGVLNVNDVLGLAWLPNAS